MTNESTQILQKLNEIKLDIDYIKEHIEDVIMTDDDIKSIKEAKKDLKEGKTRRL